MATKTKTKKVVAKKKKAPAKKATKAKTPCAWGDWAAFSKRLVKRGNMIGLRFGASTLFPAMWGFCGPRSRAAISPVR